MARPLRIEFPGALYHLTARGNAQQPIFRDDRDRHSFLQILGQTLTDGNGICHAYCLMSNHAMRAAYFEHGYRQKEIADHLGLHATTVSNILRKMR